MENLVKAVSKIDESISKLVKHGVDSAIHANLNNFNIPDCNKNIILITQYHKSLNKDRDLEIIESIKNNIKNPLINKIFLFTENVSKKNTKKIFKDSNKIKIIPETLRLNYKMAFSFIKTHYYNNNNNIYLVCNSDCYFDESLKTLKYINFEERPSPLFLTMTRYEKTDNKLDVGKNLFVENWSEENFKIKISKEEYKELPYLEPWSSDAWAFKFNSLKLIEDNLDDFSQHLGTNLCEILLVDKLIKLGVDCKNIGLAGYVKCIHNHKSLYREKHNIKNFIENKIPGFVPDPSRGVIRTKDNSINNCWRLISRHNWLDAPNRNHCYSSFFIRNIFDFLYKNKEKYDEDVCILRLDPKHKHKFKDGFGKIVASKRQSDLKKNFHTELNAKPFNPKKFPDKYKYITLITQFYPEENKARLNEIISAIQYNINNPFIDEIILLAQYDKSDTESISSFKSLFYNTDKVNFVIDEKRLTYSQAITYAKIHNNQDSLYFIINNDCFFDERIEIVKKINMLNGKRILCFTRKDMNKNGIITHAVENKVGDPSSKYKFNTEFEIDFKTQLEEKNTIDIASQDAWGFTLDYDPGFDFDIALGTFNCEAEFTILNYTAGFVLSNLIKYCPCIHIHNTNLRKESSIKNNYFNPLYDTNGTIDNYINGTWRRRVPENYIDKNSVFQEYTDFLVLDFEKLL